MFFVRERRRDDGFSLVETMAALLIFAIVTLGVIPLLASSIGGANLARSFTVGKNVAQEAMERVRGLPYFISYGAQTRKVDVLDFYLPTYPTSGGQTGTYTTTCTSGSRTNPACPLEIPQGYTVEFKARFVNKADTSPPCPAGHPAGTECYTTELPDSTSYAWNGLNGLDVPPTRLMEIAITTSWQLGARSRSFTLKSLVADRKLGEARVLGIGDTEFAVHVLTSYVDQQDPPRVSDLIATLGSSESLIETRLLSQADQNSQAGSFLLVREETPTEPTAVELRNQVGATTVLHASPDQGPLGTSVAAFSVTHPDLLGVPTIAALANSTTDNQTVSASGEVPNASGSGTVIGGSTEGVLEFWVNNQAEIGTSTSLQLAVDPNSPLFSVRRGAGSVAFSSKAQTTSLLSGDRKVLTEASASVGRMRLFPTHYVTSGSSKAVVLISDFTASVSCKSTATSTSSATASYGGTLQYWAESAWLANRTLFAGDAALTGGQYSAGINLSDDAGRAVMNNLKPDVDTDGQTENGTQVAGTNPMLWESPLDANSYGSPLDIYLFPQEHEHLVGGNLIHHEHPGYISFWEATRSLPASVSTDFRTTSASIPPAIRINTVPTDPDVEGTALNIEVGRLTCESVDRR
jgi:prepilin-type N-terminal cleavage/methylation domain-containing protein